MAKKLVAYFSASGCYEKSGGKTGEAGNRRSF